MSPLQKTIRDQNRLAALFVQAAVEMDKPTQKCGCCKALAAVQRSAWYNTPAHEAFKDAFPWTMDFDELCAHWRTRDGAADFIHYPEDARQARVLALLFCAEMARLGEIG